MLTLSVTAVVLAQGECPALVQEVLESTDKLCSGIERNQACYGNIQIDATAQPEVTDLKFSSPGDIEDIARFQSFDLAGLSTPDTWGVMLMQVQANLPD